MPRENELKTRTTGGERQVTDQGRLIWAERFTRENLSSYRPGDWENLREDVLAFFGWNRSGSSKTNALNTRTAIIVATNPDQLSNRDISELQRAALKAIKGKAFPVTGRFSYTDSVIRPLVSVHIPDPKAAFLFLLIDLLHRMDEMGLEWSKCRSCGTKFIRVRRQIFCSTHCRWAQNKRDARPPSGGRKHGKKR